MTWQDGFQKLQEACMGDPTTQCVGGTPFDTWPILVPIALAVGMVALIMKAIRVKRGGPP